MSAKTRDQDLVEVCEAVGNKLIAIIQRERLHSTDLQDVPIKTLTTLEDKLKAYVTKLKTVPSTLVYDEVAKAKAAFPLIGEALSSDLIFKLRGESLLSVVYLLAKFMQIVNEVVV